MLDKDFPITATYWILATDYWLLDSLIEDWKLRIFIICPARLAPLIAECKAIQESQFTDCNSYQSAILNLQS